MPDKNRLSVHIYKVHIYKNQIYNALTSSRSAVGERQLWNVFSSISDTLSSLCSSQLSISLWDKSLCLLGSVKRGSLTFSGNGMDSEGHG